VTLTFWSLFLFPFLLTTVVLSFVTLNRYIRYKERVALAQLGYAPDENSQRTGQRIGNRGVLWGGVITAASGLALLLGLGTLGVGAWLIAGLLPLCVGLGMLLIYYLTMGQTREHEAAAKEAPKEEEPEAGAFEAVTPEQPEQTLQTAALDEAASNAPDSTAR